MVIFTLSQLKEIEEAMLGECFGAEAEVIIDLDKHELVMRWRGDTSNGLYIYRLEKRISFDTIKYGADNLLLVKAGRGSVAFTEGVN